MKRNRLIQLGCVLLAGCSSGDKSTTSPETPTPLSVRFCQQSGWLAYQNSGADWQFAPITSDTITFNATESLSIAFSAGPEFTQVWSLDREELLELSGSSGFGCFTPPPPATKTLFANVTGLFPGEVFQILTPNGGSGGPPTTNTIRLAVPTGPVDLVGLAMDDTPERQVNRIIIRRQVNLPDSATMPAFDFSSSEMRGLKAVSALISGVHFATNTVQGSIFRSEQFFIPLGESTVSSTGSVWGVPAELMLGDEINEYSVAECPSICTRRVTYYFRALPSTVVFGLGAAPAPTDQVTLTSFPCTRLSWTTPVQGDYPKFANAVVTWGQNQSNAFAMTVTAGFTHHPPADAWRFEVPGFTRPDGSCLIPRGQTPAGTATVGENLNLFTGKLGVDGYITHTASSAIYVH